MTAHRGAVWSLAGVLAFLVVPVTLAAQPQVSIWLGATGTALRTRTVLPNSTIRLRGELVGGEASFATGPFALRLGYAEGSANTGAIGRDHVEGFVLLGVRPIDGLTVGGGPRATAYVTDSTTERWLHWQVGARYEGMLLQPLVRAYGELWIAVAGTAGRVGDYGGGRGGGAGLEVRLGRMPIVARLGYAVAQSRLEGGALRETMEGLVLGIGYAR